MTCTSSGWGVGEVVRGTSASESSLPAVWPGSRGTTRIAQPGGDTWTRCLGPVTVGMRWREMGDPGFRQATPV